MIVQQPPLVYLRWQWQSPEFADMRICVCVCVLAPVRCRETPEPHSILEPPLRALPRRGSSVIGSVAGPITIVWFVTIAALGVHNLVVHPEAARLVLQGLS